MAQISPPLEEFEFLNMQHTANKFNIYGELSVGVNCANPWAVTADQHVHVWVLLNCRQLSVLLCPCLVPRAHICGGAQRTHSREKAASTPWTTPLQFGLKGWFMAPYSPGLQTPHSDLDLLPLPCKTGISLTENIDSSQGYSVKLPYRGATCKGFPIQRT
jgi:hypothetical protein